MNDAEEALPQYVLHHWVHEFWTQSRLCFIRIGFVVYDPTEVMSGIEQLLVELDSSSFAVYELLGEFDILVRAWIPVEHDKSDVEEAVISNLLRVEVDRKKIDILFVKSTDRHWVFCNSDGTDVDPPDSELDALPSPEESLRINRTLAGEDDGLNEQQVAHFLDVGILGPLIHKDELDIREITESHGIKFVTLIRTRPLAADERRRLRQHINSRVRILAVLVDDEQNRLVGEVSLYWTPNEIETEFVLMGRIRPDSFHEAIADLIDFVIDPSMIVFGAHPITNMLARPGFVSLRETLPLPISGTETPIKDQPEIQELLEGLESTRVEFKGSVYVDINKWMFAGGRPVISDELFVDGIVRTVAAFLNSPQVGIGRLIIGALEVTPGLERARQGATPEVRARFAEISEVGRCLIFGVEPDIQALKSAGRNVGDIDGLMIHVAQRLEESLTGSGRSGALGAINIESYEIAGRTLLDVTVTTTAPRALFHFVGPEGETFTVRAGNRSLNLSRDDEMDWRERWRLDDGT